MTSTNGRTATLPVFVERHTVRKHDSLDSFTDMSVSFVDAGGALDEKKDFSPDASFGALSLKDVGGTLADYNDGPYSPAPSSGSSSAASTLSSPVDSAPPSPRLTATRPDIEISSVRHLDVGEIADQPTYPEPVHITSTAPRHAPDAPTAAYRNSIDIV
ncbi:hypothetical protein BDZ94DRAFT_1246774 [Collybia nuda]|uniref:Uncharacterized protein n=1 Tax=Collybia nuda TaxID=64659 RepID=A0A9P6CJ65_9AGAR|nr:hypothetical protein BDZ94DRAFT_1246774 [Collybia nuda]